MCGILGQFSKHSVDLRELLQARALKLDHRGPDCSGIWVDNCLGFAHTRLSIQDLSNAGNQPMESERYVLSFNGEVYNFKRLKSELNTHRFNGGSDTEVLLAAIEVWGLEKALDRVNGMFAFALWDKVESSIYLVRDRLGQKPLYYGWSEEGFCFASELKALGEGFTLNPEALSLLLSQGYIPAPHSIYQNVFKLPAGCILKLGQSSLGSYPDHFSADPRTGAALKPWQYWSARMVYESSQKFLGDQNEADEELEHLLNDSLDLRMISDRPLGAFLSGGIDSSLLVSLMMERSPSALKTFTIGYEDRNYNESHFAREIAAHLKTNHSEKLFQPAEALDCIPQIPSIFDEPLADPSVLPTLLVSRLAKEEVTVAISGDGGDEFFCGYNRYHHAENIWRRIAPFPRAAKQTSAQILKLLQPNQWDKYLSALSYRFGRRVDKFTSMLNAKSKQELYCTLVRFWDQLPLQSPELPETVLSRGISHFHEPLRSLMLTDTLGYLPENILQKVDRASMSCSLEVRSPILDHRIFEFSASLPTSFMSRNGSTKDPLKRLLAKRLPREMFERPKVGFGVPIDEWLRGPLKEWADDLLSKEKLYELFDYSTVSRHWKEHSERKANWDYQLWSVLVFQAWLSAR